eukprot:scaffold584_cov132-Cylindrotheca_fusiformis.AAC.35
MMCVLCWSTSPSLWVHLVIVKQDPPVQNSTIVQPLCQVLLEIGWRFCRTIRNGSILTVKL